jgi:hypothetical protein
MTTKSKLTEEELQKKILMEHDKKDLRDFRKATARGKQTRLDAGPLLPAKRSSAKLDKLLMVKKKKKPQRINVVVSMSLPPETLKQLEYLMKQRSLSRSTVVVLAVHAMHRREQKEATS